MSKATVTERFPAAFCVKEFGGNSFRVVSDDKILGEGATARAAWAAAARQIDMPKAEPTIAEARKLTPDELCAAALEAVYPTNNKVPSLRTLQSPALRAEWEGWLRENVPGMCEAQASQLFERVRERRLENERAWGKRWNKSGSECKATREQTVEYNTVACALGYAIRLLFKFHPQIQIGRVEAHVALKQAQEQLEGLKVEVERLEVAAAEPRSERRLLVMACSATKRADKGTMCALARYDGPSFRVLRNFLGERAPSEAGLDVWILSAEFGLIHWDEQIPNYDTRMNGFLANKLQGAIRRDLKNVLEVRQPSEAFLMLGKDYLEAVGPFEGLGLPATTIPEGGIGYKLGALKRWLEQRTEGK